MIQDEVDFLLLSPASTTGWDTVLQDAQTAGTQVILFDRKLEADESMYVAVEAHDDDVAVLAVGDAVGVQSGHGAPGHAVVLRVDHVEGLAGVAQQMIQDEVDYLLLSPASTPAWDTLRGPGCG